MNTFAPDPSMHFYTKSGLQFCGAGAAVCRDVRQKLISHLGLNLYQISEAASYSLAMVVRFALGLSADNSRVTVLAADNLSGLTALATTRHLVNSGGAADIFIAGDPVSDEFSRQIGILSKMGIPVTAIQKPGPDAGSLKNIETALNGSHNAICGLFGFGEKDFDPGLIDLLNESKTPVHSIDCPLGMDPDSGAPGTHPLYSSSTLSLGLPLTGLFFSDVFVGRHYLCDISISRELYAECGFNNLAPLFSEQPVVQIFPVKPEEQEESDEL